MEPLKVLVLTDHHAGVDVAEPEGMGKGEEEAKNGHDAVGCGLVEEQDEQGY